MKTRCVASLYIFIFFSRSFCFAAACSAEVLTLSLPCWIRRNIISSLSLIIIDVQLVPNQTYEDICGEKLETTPHTPIDIYVTISTRKHWTTMIASQDNFYCNTQAFWSRNTAEFLPVSYLNLEPNKIKPFACNEQPNILDAVRASNLLTPNLQSIYMQNSIQIWTAILEK